MSKIFEYVIFHQLFDYMSINNLITIEQFGFRTGHSTELAAIQLVDHKANGHGGSPYKYIY